MEISTHKKIGLFIVWFIVAVVCLELLLRVFGAGYLLYRRGFQSGLKDDPTFYKILCLGDSFTLGIGAGRGKDYPAQLENMLKESRLKKRFKVINAGVAGQNSSELLYNLDRNLDKYSPEMVVLMIGMNDEFNTHLHNRALGERGWYVKLSSWITGLRTYKLFNFIRSSIVKLHNGQESEQKVYLSNRGDARIAQQEENPVTNEVKRLFENGQNEKAKNLLVETVNKENVDGWEYLNIANEYKAHETEEYIIKKMLATDAPDEWLRVTLGKIYLVQNKFDDTERVFKSILEDNPRNNYIRFNLARLYMSQKRYSEAGSLLKDAIKVQGKSLIAVKLLSYCYVSQGKEAEADSLQEDISFYKKITELNFSAIKNKIFGRNIKLVVMSYPQIYCIPDNLMRGVTVIDNMNSFSKFSVVGKAKLFSADNHHCNAQGYRLIARNLFNHILGRSDL